MKIIKWSNKSTHNFDQNILQLQIEKLIYFSFWKF